MIELCNLRKEKPVHSWDIRVDRSTVLGNPFKNGSREEQCDNYQEYFDNLTTPPKGLARKNVVNELAHLHELHKQYGKLRLFCWCVPLRCHSMTIKAYLEGMP